MAWCQPECVIDDASATLAKRGRLLGLVPRAPAIARTKDRRAEVPGARCCQHGLAVARVRDAMVDDVSEKLRARDTPAPARRVAFQLPQSFSGRDQQHCAA